MKHWAIGILKQIFTMITLLLAVSAFAFTLTYLSPIDPIEAYIGGHAIVSPEQREAIAERWGLNDPPVTRYFHWLGNLLQGDFGVSTLYLQPVGPLIYQRFQLSFVLMAVAWVTSGMVGFGLGILAAAKQGKWTDKLIKSYCLLLQSSPSFWTGMVTLMFFAVWLGWFPMGMAVPAGKLAEEVTMADRLHHMILPGFVLSLTGISHITLHTREKLIQAMESDYALFAYSRGESKWEFIRRHGLRNILFPAVTLHFATFSELFGGSVLVESVFSYPGLGDAIISAGLHSDIPLLLGSTLFSAFFVFCGNLMANLLYPIIDPRVREGGAL